MLLIRCNPPLILAAKGFSEEGETLSADWWRGSAAARAEPPLPLFVLLLPGRVHAVDWLGTGGSSRPPEFSPGWTARQVAAGNRRWAVTNLLHLPLTSVG